MIAAAIADPLVESASNAGWFGPGNFTDHSTWDVVPVLLVGLVFVALHLCSRLLKTLAASQISSQWPRFSKDAMAPSVLRLVPVICVAQIAILYLMETTEQRVVYGHVLGGTMWLGGPVAVSLAAHATICVLVAVLASKVLRAFADAAMQLLCAMRALTTLYVRASHPTFLHRPDFSTLRRGVGLLGHAGERAPPILTA